MGMEMQNKEGQNKKPVGESASGVELIGDFIAKIFYRYLEDLGLSEKDLKDKKILDVGAGSRAFAGHCIRSGICKEVYSLEPKIGKINDEEEKIISAELNNEVKKQINFKTVRGKMENLPFEDQSMDLQCPDLTAIAMKKCKKTCKSRLMK